MKVNFIITLALALVSVSCAGIKTRKQLRMDGVKIERTQSSSQEAVVEAKPIVQEKQVVVERVIEKPVTVASNEPAKVTPIIVDNDPVNQKMEMAAELRRLSGELQDIKDAKAMEAKTNQDWRATQEQKLQLMQSKLTIYEQSIAALEEEISHLKALKAKKPKKVKGIFERAESHMKSKDWKKAILEFENYRKKYPRGRRVSMATYFIGVSFQELGLKEEAKAFFQETIDKYPKTSAFNKAKYRLKQLR